MADTNLLVGHGARVADSWADGGFPASFSRRLWRVLHTMSFRLMHCLSICNESHCFLSSGTIFRMHFDFSP